uniref:Uncharacterized protein n=2 Tax=Caenorhabditis japonica TaxID=281687 RepID=K7IA43_CAEJA
MEGLQKGTIVSGNVSNSWQRYPSKVPV